MGMSTVTAARILKGQLAGRTGEEEKLAFETFPHLGLAKVKHFACFTCKLNFLTL